MMHTKSSHKKALKRRNTRHVVAYVLSQIETEIQKLDSATIALCEVDGGPYHLKAQVLIDMLAKQGMTITKKRE